MKLNIQILFIYSNLIYKKENISQYNEKSNLSLCMKKIIFQIQF